jgi:hypothetical protein
MAKPLSILRTDDTDEKLERWKREAREEAETREKSPRWTQRDKASDSSNGGSDERSMSGGSKEDRTGATGADIGNRPE